MPLTRYEIRNEYSLANPDLYRAAAKDDPEGLLEGVAMAGLVGIVRQLGDLAEFAAEVFHDLHEEVLATAARGHELLIRVQQLEAELPAVEKAMLVDTNYVNFAYNPGLEWHANIRNDQNHFTQGDLPRFIRNFYEECRGPPRLFLLDKFDVAGAGACLKRYTDPSFFKMEWASSELLKAEKEQQDKRARRIKKKRQRKRNGEIKEPSQAPLRVLDVQEDGNIPVARFRSSSLDLRANHKNEPISPYVEQDSAQASSSQLIHQHEDDSSNNSKGMYAEDVNETPNDTHLAFQSADDNFASGEMSKGPRQAVNDRGLEDEDMQADQNTADDVASETDNYMDALTTMDSEVETDSEVKTKPEIDSEIDSYTRVDLSNLHTLNEPSEELIGHQINSMNATVEPVETKEPTVASPLELFDKKDPVPFDRSYSSSSSPEFNADAVERSNGSSPVKMNAASISDSYLDLSGIDDVPEVSKISMGNDNKESEMESMMTPFNLLPEPVVPLNNGNQIKLAARSIPLVIDTYHKSDEFSSEGAVAPEPESGSFVGPESSPTKAFPEHLRSPTHAQSSKPNETSSTKIFPEHLGSPSTHAQHSKFNERIAALVEEKDSLQGVSEEESSESPRELSSPSSSDTNIQPIRWARDSPGSPNDFLDSDDEIDGMQVSPSPPSSSSSSISSPRPMSLATTIFHMDHEVRPQTLLSSQESADSSPRSSTELSIRSPASPMKPATEAVEPSVNNATCSPDPSPDSISEPLPNPVEEVQVQRNLPVAVEETPLQKNLPAEVPQMRPGFVMNELEQQPPPPPLPPLEWRIARRLHKSHLSVSKNTESSIAPSVSLSFPIRPASKSPLVPLTSNVNSPLIPETMADDFRDPTAPSVPLSFPMRADTTLKASKSPLVPSTKNANSPLIPETMADDLGDSTAPSIPLSFPMRPDTSSKASKSSLGPLTRNVNSPLIPETMADDLKVSTPPSVPLSFPASPLIPETMGDDLRDSTAPSVPLSFPTRPDTTSRASKSPLVPSTENANSPLIPETMADDLRDSNPSISNTMDEGTSCHTDIVNEFPSVQYSSDLPSPVMQTPELTKLKELGLSSAQPCRVLAEQDDNYGVNLSVPPLTPEHEISRKDGPDLTPGVSKVDIPTALAPSKGAEQAAQNIEPAILKLDRKDSLIEAIASHDRNTLRKIPERSRSSMTALSDEREVLLEQIRTGSFSLRHTKVEKHEAPRPATNINVAAILEKANAIRQAFAGSDDEDDDDWSDS